MNKNLIIPKEKIAAFCRKWKIAEFSLFGSVLREDFGPDSDVDVLVEFEADHVPGFFALAHMERELSVLFERKADLRTPEDLSRLFRDEVIRRAEVQYVQ